jgi:hypothetical protein
MHLSAQGQLQTLRKSRHVTIHANRDLGQDSEALSTAKRHNKTGIASEIELSVHGRCSSFIQIGFHECAFTNAHCSPAIAVVDINERSSSRHSAPLLAPHTKLYALGKSETPIQGESRSGRAV